MLHDMYKNTHETVSLYKNGDDNILFFFYIHIKLRMLTVRPHLTYLTVTSFSYVLLRFLFFFFFGKFCSFFFYNYILVYQSLVRNKLNPRAVHSYFKLQYYMDGSN